MVKAPELMAYQVFSSQVKNEADVYALIGKRLGKSPEEVKADWANESKKPLIIEQFRRAWADMNDFANVDLYLESLFPRSYLVLKNSNILENCQKITQHLVSLGLE